MSPVKSSIARSKKVQFEPSISDNIFFAASGLGIAVPIMPGAGFGTVGFFFTLPGNMSCIESASLFHFTGDVLLLRLNAKFMARVKLEALGILGKLGIAGNLKLDLS